MIFWDFWDPANISFGDSLGPKSLHSYPQRGYDMFEFVYLFRVHSCEMVRNFLVRCTNTLRVSSTQVHMLAILYGVRSSIDEVREFLQGSWSFSKRIDYRKGGARGNMVLYCVLVNSFTFLFN